MNTEPGIYALDGVREGEDFDWNLAEVWPIPAG